MQVNSLIFKELIKRGYSFRGKTRIWDVADSKLWYLTPELSEGFLGLKKYNPYRRAVIDKELGLISNNAKKIIKSSGFKKFNLIDLGCGNGLKAEQFIKSIDGKYEIMYCPVDINSHYIDMTKKTIAGLKSKNVKGIKWFVSDFKNLGDLVGLLRTPDYQKNLSLLFGETISHYEVHDFLYTLSESMFKGDVLVIGNGIRIGERFANLEKYKDPLFNDWFIHVIKGLGFQENEVEYDVRFTNKRLEGFYRVKVDKKIEFNGKKVSFRKGDEVVVAIQYKYFEKELKKFCKMYFGKVDVLKSKDGEYGLFVCRK